MKYLPTGLWNEIANMEGMGHFQDDDICHNYQNLFRFCFFIQL